MRSSVETCFRFIDQHAIKLAIAACVLVVLIGALLISAISGFDDTPQWWGEVDRVRHDDPNVIERAERVENAITTQLTTLRDADDPSWAVAVDQDQANAWLAARLIDTIVTHQGEDAWPREIERILVGIEADQCTIGARVKSAAGTSILSARVGFSIDSNGDLWATISSLHVGSTRIPMGLLSMGSSESISSKLRIGPAKIEIGDGRVAKLLAVRMSGGRMELMMETRVAD